MNFIRLFTLVCFAAIVSACAGLPQQTTVVEKRVLIEPADRMLIDCESDATPPDPVAYQGASVRDREGMLTDLNTTLMTDLEKCSIRWQKLRQWYDEQRSNTSTAAAPKP